MFIWMSELESGHCESRILAFELNSKKFRGQHTRWSSLDLVPFLLFTLYCTLSIVHSGISSSHPKDIYMIIPTFRSRAYLKVISRSHLGSIFDSFHLFERRERILKRERKSSLPSDLGPNVVIVPITFMIRTLKPIPPPSLPTLSLSLFSLSHHDFRLKFLPSFLAHQSAKLTEPKNSTKWTIHKRSFHYVHLSSSLTLWEVLDLWG